MRSTVGLCAGLCLLATMLAPTSTFAVCGDTLVDVGEECDDGGVCIDSVNAGTPCDDAGDCMGGQCRTFGGDGCAANCTFESDVPFQLGTSSGSAVRLNGLGVDLAIALTGTQTLTIGKERGGNIPVVIKASSVAIQMSPPFGCGCFRPIVRKTCGGTRFEIDGITPAVDCTPDYTNGDVECTGLEPCAFVHGAGVYAEGTIGCSGLSGTDLSVEQDAGGSMGSPGPVLETVNGSGGPGSAALLSSAAIVTVLDNCLAITPYHGDDNTFCTDDDPYPGRGVINTGWQVTGTATSIVRNSDGLDGVDTGPISVVGDPFICANLVLGFSGGAKLVNGFTRLDQPLPFGTKDVAGITRLLSEQDCGNGVPEAGEDCDDGDLINGNGCDTNCTVTACGNGITTAGEECDDDNTNSADGCSATCQLELTNFVAYKLGIPKVDPADVPLLNGNLLPAPWVVTADDLSISGVDDPENFQIKKAKAVLRSAIRDTQVFPAIPTIAYLRYEMKSGAETVGPMNGGGTFDKPPKHVARIWQLSNSSGTINVASKKVTGVLVPTAVDEGSPPAAPADANHYVCYQVKATKDITDQTPDKGDGTGKFRTDLQAYFKDEFDDCAFNELGSTSFAGSFVPGKCLLDLKKPVELCNPMTKTAVAFPRVTMAVISGSAATPDLSLLCYKTAVAKEFKSTVVAGMALGINGAEISPAQRKHATHKVKDGNPLYTTPGNLFTQPVMVDTKKQDLVCVPTEVLAVNPAP